MLEAIEATYAQIVEAHGRERTGLFAAAGCPPQRRLVDDPRKVVVTVSEAEAEILAEVLSRTTLSLSAFVDEALRLAGGDPPLIGRVKGSRRSTQNCVVMQHDVAHAYHGGGS
ncbi:MAG: hypothetical protein ACYCXY_11725 [Acidimicrobiales bacterium]